jgi:hypothetical protein
MPWLDIKQGSLLIVNSEGPFDPSNTIISMNPPIPATGSPTNLRVDSREMPGRLIQIRTAEHFGGFEPIELQFAV